MPFVKYFVAINKHICFVHIVDRKTSVVINYYTPIEEKEEKKKNIFYEHLEWSFDFLPKNCIKVIVWDFDAQIGKEAIFQPTIRHKSLHCTSYDNDMKLILVYY